MAGERLLALREELTEARAHSGVLKREGDRQAHDLIMGELARIRPNDAVLSEEGRDRPERLVAERVWIIDPLDGTREYGEGRQDWAVHVALVIANQPVAGAVALPALGLTLSTAEPPPLPALRETTPRMIVSRSRPPVAAIIIAEALGAELISLGSAGAKTMAVVLGEADIYAHSGGQYEWDSCAPIAVARATGLHASRIDGSELVYNQPDPYLPDLLVCHPRLAAAALAALRG
ncbi:MAG: 3'(2'),5'-bisphosphate nucleotidase CysQ [Actinobacteria bacterium]|nr:MAG: 3'(2'),5'-bisphosphate nucleotidase CysQ [Actinomycetota bacterium]